MKTSDSERNLGFESLTLRQKKCRLWAAISFGGEFKGFEEAGPTEGGVKNMPVACFLGRGRIHRLMNAPGTGVGISLLFVTEELDRATSKVYTNNKRNAALGGLT